ncbi:condensin complex subunit 3 [Phlebotomus argentipes]|uniref:condensin complex subunit 3 n=1 Tax=Phlebotomus argentipes TaxID=94469 RepID=UPI0028935A25|nr:condensin complex subunit 3 [Phlebotomus argentipes]
MPRKRKIRVAQNENEPPAKPANSSNSRAPKNKEIVEVICRSQDSVTQHDIYVKDLKGVYAKSNHKTFLSDFLICFRAMAVKDVSNEYTTNALKFCAKFVAAHNKRETGETHPLVTDVFNYVLEMTSNNVNIRLRLCEFVNMILNSLEENALLDDNICDKILKYMCIRLSDMNPNIRIQAVLALQRLQIPEEPNDTVVKQYFFHLSTDPSAQVRQTIITCIVRNMITIPHIIERLWDLDEKVRRHVIIQMSTHSVRMYMVAERLKFLEQGLNDNSELVRKATVNVMLPRWVDTYNHDYIALLGALKMDTNDKEMQRFKKCALQVLQYIFKKADAGKIVTELGFDAPDPTRRDTDDEDEEEDVTTTDNQEFPRCVPIKKLSVEVAVYWEAAVDYLQQNDFDELNVILPELTVFCQYVEKYCESTYYESDKWQQMKNQYILLSLLEIVAKYDLGDEVGRNNLKELLSTVMSKYNLDEPNICVMARIFEQVYPITDDRLNTVMTIVSDILQLGDNSATINSEMESALFQKAGIDLQLRLSSLKVKMMELKEQENVCGQKKDYVNAQKATEEWEQCNEEYIKLLQPLLADQGNSDETSLSASLLKATHKIGTETTLRCLQITYHIICSAHTQTITPSVVDLYNKFICRHMNSEQVNVRDWAFKCATTCSMLYSMLAKEVSRTLSEQFVKNQNIRIWTTAIQCLFELVDRYGLDFFMDAPSEDDTVLEKTVGRSKTRQLFSTSTLLQSDQEAPLSLVEVIGHLSVLLENCEHRSILQALVVGFCRFVLHGHYTESNIVSKLMLFYFNPATDAEITQILGIFFENLTSERKQEYLQPALLPTLFFIFEAPHDSPLQEIKPEKVMKFVIDVTRPQFCSHGLNIHNTIGMSFMSAIQDNVTQKEVLKVLSKGLLLLEISDDRNFRTDLKNSCEQLLKVTGLDEKVARNISAFKDLLDGIKRPSLTFSSTRITTSTFAGERDSEEEDKIEETEKEAQLESIVEVTEENSRTTEAKDLNETENDSVFLHESLKSAESSEAEVIEPSEDETTKIFTRRQMTRSRVSAERSTVSSPKTPVTRSGRTLQASKKRTIETRTPNARTKITRSAAAAATTPAEAKKKDKEPKQSKQLSQKEKKKVEGTLSQSSSASSVTSVGPSVAKRMKDPVVAVSPLSASFIQRQMQSPRTRSATTDDYIQSNIMTRTRRQNLSPSRIPRSKSATKPKSKK